MVSDFRSTPTPPSSSKPPPTLLAAGEVPASRVRAPPWIQCHPGPSSGHTAAPSRLDSVRAAPTCHHLPSPLQQQGRRRELLLAPCPASSDPPAAFFSAPSSAHFARREPDPPVHFAKLERARIRPLASPNGDRAFRAQTLVDLLLCFGLLLLRPATALT
jgi:hypothetical protein